MREARREVVLASAGSGKTYRLSAAYLELIAHGVDPRGVLATTFTRKAAGEIAQRVLRRAVGAGTDSALASRLDEETRSVLGADGWARVAYGLARRIDSMRVRTIDGFLVSVAQGATQELGLSPGWGLLSEQEEGELRLRAVDIAIGESTREEALELLRMLHAGDPRSSVRSSVAQVASSGSAAFWAADGSPEPWHAVAEPGGALDEAALREALGVAERAALPLTGKGEPHKTWVGAARKLLEGVRAGNYAYALDSNLCRNLFVDDARFASKPIDDGHRGAFGPLLRHAGALMVRTLAEQTSASYTLIARTELALDALKRARGAWTFADIPRMLGRLDDARLMGVLESLDAGVEHLLLDEYQDTSLEQHAMVAPMLEEIASEASASRSAVCVGDVKQSLYMWREATPEILGTLSDRYPSLDGRSLSKSWRTSSVVLDEVNAVFEDIATNDALVDGMRGGGEDFAEHWETQTAAREVPGFFVFEAVDASEEEAAGDARFERAAMCAREIVDRAPDATVGILTRVKKGVIPRMLEALKAAGVEASEEGGNPLTDSPAVACAVSALRFASRPGGTVWAYHAFASALGPVCGVTDPADTAEVREAGRAIRRMLAERGPAAVFEAWRKGLIGRMTARDASRFAQLVELAERLEREGAPLDPGSLSERIETERVEATSAARVRVMTIHASKGLEFDAVILPDLERAFGISRDSFIVEREGSLGGVRAVTRFPRKEVRDASPELTRMHDGAMRRHVLGELCGLYVGMTRARRWLHMIVDAPKEPGAYRASLAGVARAALAPGLGDAGVLHAEGDPSCLDGLAGDAPGPVDGVPAVRLRLRTGGGLGGGLGAGALARRSPSTIGRDEGSVAASRLLSLDRDAADIGTLIHDACELIGWTDEPGWAFDVASFARSVAERRGVAEGVARGAVERVARALGAPGVHEALARSRYNSPCELWRERAFAARVERDGSPVLLRGRFDRVVVGRDEGGGVSWCEVLDFKSEAQPAGDVGEAAGAYRTQMEAYRDALVAMTGVRTEDVRLTLVFIDRREVVTLDQSAAGGVEGS